MYNKYWRKIQIKSSFFQDLRHRFGSGIRFFEDHFYLPQQQMMKLWEINTVAL